MESHVRRHESAGSSSSFIPKDVKTQREKLTRNESAVTIASREKSQRDKRKQHEDAPQIMTAEVAALEDERAQLEMNVVAIQQFLSEDAKGSIPSVSKESSLPTQDNLDLRSPRTSDATIPEAQVQGDAQAQQLWELREREDALRTEKEAFRLEVERSAQAEKVRKEEIWNAQLKMQTHLESQQTHFSKMQDSWLTEKEEQKAELRSKKQELESRAAELKEKERRLAEQEEDLERRLADLEVCSAQRGDKEEKMKARQKELEEKENYLREAELNRGALVGRKHLSPRGNKENLDTALRRDLEEQRERAVQIKRGSPDERARRDSVASSEASTVGPRSST